MARRGRRFMVLWLGVLVLGAAGNAGGVFAETVTRVLDDGTTLIDVFSPTGVPVQEEVILPHGRRKITYFDDRGEPQYASVDTGGGAFGLMYYITGREAPVFKFWDYGRGAAVAHNRRPGDLVIQVYRSDFTVQRQLELDLSDAPDREFVGTKRPGSPGGVYLTIGIGLLAAAAGAGAGYGLGYARGRRA
ncbi:MAG: hypothetical protein R6U25_08730 [Alkalispirochaeta sp.]